MQLSPQIKKGKSVFQMISFLQPFLYLGFKIVKRLTKHEYFLKNGEKSSYMVHFARIPCIIDENDVKNTKKRDLKFKNQILRNSDLSLKWYPDCTLRHTYFLSLINSIFYSNKFRQARRLSCFLLSQ